MAKVKFKKGDSVVCKYTDGDLYIGEFQAFLADGKTAKVKFDDGEIFKANVKDIMTKAEFDAKQAEDEKQNSSPELTIEDGETIDEDLDNEIPDEAVDDEFTGMTRAELKKYIAKNELPIKVTQGMTDDDIRIKVRELAEPEDLPEPLEPEDEAEPTGDEFTGMDRKQLKQYIAKEGLAIVVTQKMTDDAIREAIRGLVNVEPEEPEELDELDELPEEIEEPVETDPLVGMDRNALKIYIRDNSLTSIKVLKSMSDEDIRNEIRKAEATVDTGEPEETTEAGAPNVDLGDNWFAMGDGKDEDFNDYDNTTYRLWMPPGAKTNVTFLTEKPFTVQEHGVKIAGKKGTRFFTCLARTGQRCPICESGRQAKTIKAFYIMDHAEYKNKKGETVKDQVRLLVIKPKAYKQFKMIVDSFFDGQPDVNYAGLQMTIMRSDDKQSPSSGDIFITTKKTKLDKKLLKGAEDFKKDFAPKTREKLAQTLTFVTDEDED